MPSMTKSISGNSGRDACHGEDQRIPLTYSTCSKGLEASGILEAFKSNSGAKGRRSTIGVRGIGFSNAFAQLDVKTLDLSVMDALTLVAASSGSRPRTGSKLARFNRQSPTGVKLYDIRPTDGKNLEWISDDYAFVTEGDFRANQKYVNANQHKESEQSARRFGGGSTLVETRPSKETAENNSKPSEEQAGARAEGLLVIHSAILSHLAADSIKAVS